VVVADEIARAITPIDPKEDVYRRVPERMLKWDEQRGSHHISARVFRDPDCRPSVYRAGLCLGSDRIQDNSTDGVLQLRVEAVRKIDPVPRFSKKGTLEQEYTVDVEHKPEGDPPSTAYAHSEIFLHPDTEHDKTCNRMYEALAYLADTTPDIWAIRPALLRRGSA
jgi:hypothetical protein